MTFILINNIIWVQTNKGISMKKIKLLAVSALVLALSACGGHSYEGTYKMDTSKESGGLGALAGAFGAADVELVIGDDYIESDGQRTEFDEIIVRESGSNKYLVMKSGDQEESLIIVNDNTLEQGNGMMRVRFVKVD